MAVTQEKLNALTRVRTIGEGTFGSTWLGRHEEFNTEVAIKEIHNLKQKLEPVVQESIRWSKLELHPNIVPITEVDVQGDSLAMVMPFEPGGSLEDWFRRYGGKAESVGEAVDILTGILNGLEHLHKNGIVHGNLKPSNIMLRRGTPRLTEFGLVPAIQPDLQNEARLETLWYSAPESLGGFFSPQTDLWSAGVIFYRLLAGRLPFPHDNRDELLWAILTQDPDPLPRIIARSFIKFLKRALHKESFPRYWKASEMQSDLLMAFEYSIMPDAELGSDTPLPQFKQTGIATLPTDALGQAPETIVMESLPAEIPPPSQTIKMETPEISVSELPTPEAEAEDSSVSFPSEPTGSIKLRTTQEIIPQYSAARLPEVKLKPNQPLALPTDPTSSIRLRTTQEIELEAQASKSASQTSIESIPEEPVSTESKEPEPSEILEDPISPDPEAVGEAAASLDVEPPVSLAKRTSELVSEVQTSEPPVTPVSLEKTKSESQITAELIKPKSSSVLLEKETPEAAPPLKEVIARAIEHNMAAKSAPVSDSPLWSSLPVDPPAAPQPVVEEKPLVLLSVHKSDKPEPVAFVSVTKSLPPEGSAPSTEVQVAEIVGSTYPKKVSWVRVAVLIVVLGGGLLAFGFWWLKNTVPEVPVVKTPPKAQPASKTTSSTPEPAKASTPEPPPSLPPAGAALTVAADGSGAFKRINDALAKARAGERIVVKPGTYRETILLDKAVELTAEGSPDQTIIESTSGPVLVVQVEKAKVQGFTLNGKAGQNNGGASTVEIKQGRVILDNCRISSDSLVCVAIYGSETTPILQNCTVSNGKASGVGAWDGAQGMIINCDISSNRWAGVVVTKGSRLTIKDSRINQNGLQGIKVDGGGSATVEKCDLTKNRKGAWSISSDATVEKIDNKE
ncbi:MAG: protein kinase [Acidobacteria bacterium]|nr:protein kinase [Acidobacteriota bacterium]